MEPLGVYKINYTVPNRDVGFNKKLRPGALFAYFQDVASLHSENIGAGVERLDSEFGVAWVLMRMRVDILKMPELYDEIELATWPQDFKVLYDRDFTLADSSGEVIVRSISTWIIMDLEKRELVRERKFDYYEADFPNERAIDKKLSRLHMPKDCRKIFEKEVGYSDIDYNGHMNNTKYIDCLMDSLGMDILREYEPASIEVNYSNEIGPGQRLGMYRTELSDDNEIFVEARGEEDDKNLFTAKVLMRKI